MKTIDKGEHLSKDVQQGILGRLVDNVPSMLGYWDATLINRHANMAYVDFFGKTPDEIHGKHMRDVIGETAFRKKSTFRNAVLMGEAQSFERAIPSPNGAGFKHTLTKYIPDIKDQSVVGFFVIVTDISEIRLVIARFVSLLTP